MNNYIKVFRIKCDNVQYSLAFIIIIVFRNFNGNNVAFHSIVVRIVRIEYVLSEITQDTPKMLVLFITCPENSVAQAA